MEEGCRIMKVTFNFLHCVLNSNCVLLLQDSSEYRVTNMRGTFLAVCMARLSEILVTCVATYKTYCYYYDVSQTVMGISKIL
jgi:hypothetical protein